MPLDGYEIEHYADFGTGEPWVDRIMVGLPELVQPAFAEEHDAFKGALGELFEALGGAFLALRQLREREAESGTAALTVAKTYESFYGHLWRAYKDRFPPVMKALGLDVGFLFQKDAAFEKRAAELVQERPELSDLVGLMRADRVQFQNALGIDYRNSYLEHRSGPIDPWVPRTFHRLDSAETSFENVWQAIEDYVALLTRATLPSYIKIDEIPEAERDPTRPTRFRFALLNRPPAA